MIPRSWLFVPADDAGKLAKAPGAGADALIVDLEDSVAPPRKAVGRAQALALLRQPCRQQAWVRVNPLSSGLIDEDLAAIVPAPRTASSCPSPIRRPTCRR